MSETVTFTPSFVPTFVGRGSKLEYVDLQCIFWGPWWPGPPALTTAAIMQAVRSIVSGAYLDGLKQYGYEGPVNVREEIVFDGAPGMAYPPAAPGVNQATNLSGVVHNFIESLLDHDRIPNVDDNHNLIVAVFLDPSVPVPLNTAANGSVTSVLGANSYIEEFEFLDDNTRFEWVWITTAGTNLSSVSQIFSHELVESITDPFLTGWQQVAPPPAQGAGQIADMCNQSAIVDGVSVAAYWSVKDGACVVPTRGPRYVTLLPAVVTTVSHKDGPPEQAYVDLGPDCDKGFFEYVERTYLNQITFHAHFVGYESPIVEWRINGQLVPLYGYTVVVPASWELPPPSSFPFQKLPKKSPTATLRSEKMGPNVTDFSIEVGPDQGNTSLGVQVKVYESFDVPSNGGNGSTVRTQSLLVETKNQEIVWGEAYWRAAELCENQTHRGRRLHDKIPDFGPPTPGDPPDLAQVFWSLLSDPSPERGAQLRRAAELVRTLNVELAEALEAHARRTP
jgi:hypothetical protein